MKKCCSHRFTRSKFKQWTRHQRVLLLFCFFFFIEKGEKSACFHDDVLQSYGLNGGKGARSILWTVKRSINSRFSSPSSSRFFLCDTIRDDLTCQLEHTQPLTLSKQLDKSLYRFHFAIIQKRYYSCWRRLCRHTVYFANISFHRIGVRAMEMVRWCDVFIG